MRRAKYSYIAFILLIITGIASYYGLIHQRENRLWPFNSFFLSNLFPPVIKHFAYKFTNPKDNLVQSFLYKIKITYHSIPDSGAVGGGGGVSNIGGGKSLVTLNNGQSFLFDEETGVFQRVASDAVMKIFSSVRDVLVFENQGNKYIGFYGTTKSSGACKRVALYLSAYAFTPPDPVLTLAAPAKLWESEDACDQPLEPLIDNNAGGRIAFGNGKIYASTGFFMGSGTLGSTPDFPQRIDSSFGKIIEIDLKGGSQIFSMGHRNPQGLFFAKSGQTLFSSEHAMRGGDELNLVRRSANFGFPCETYSTPYGYDFSSPQPQTKLLAKAVYCEGKKFDDPLFYWPEITGISQGIEYAGEEFQAYSGNLLVGSLSGTSIFRIQLGEKNNVMFIERINLHERVRDLSLSEKGRIIVLTDGGSVLVLSALR